MPIRWINGQAFIVNMIDGQELKELCEPASPVKGTGQLTPKQVDMKTDDETLALCRQYPHLQLYLLAGHDLATSEKMHRIAQTGIRQAGINLTNALKTMSQCFVRMTPIARETTTTLNRLGLACKVSMHRKNRFRKKFAKQLRQRQGI